MPLLFSYGTLQDRAVQIATFGRRLDGQAEVLPGYERGQVAIDQPEVRATGMTHYENAVFTGRPESRIEGMALEVSANELVAADGYEAPAAYTRAAVTLASGAAAWVYLRTPAP
ncbi:MAG: gamma-glutamylcyclotransferase family protein [Acidobacteriota bacterium]